MKVCLYQLPILLQLMLYLYQNTSLRSISRATWIQLIFWATILSLPYLFTPPTEKRNPEHNLWQAFITITTFLWIGLFYFNALILVPRFLYNRKYIIYLLILIGSFGIIALAHRGLVVMLGIKFPESGRKLVLGSILPFLIVIMVSTTYKTIIDRFKADALAAAAQKENLKSELSFLRSQISPHFLFNVLNNVVSLVRSQSDQLEPTVLKLSSLMQYMLYDTDEEKVLLSDEAGYLQSYIDLQQQRFGEKVKISSTLKVSDDSLAIEPMLLIPFVENAFKHGIGLISDPFIEVNLHTAGNTLHFSVKNKYSEADTSKDKSSGIGLANVQRRLELLYDRNQQLNIKKENGSFSVDLQINLS